MTDVLKDIEALVEERLHVVNDPLNGCPDDFDEAYVREMIKLIERATREEHTVDDISAACITGVRKAHASLSL